MKKFGRLLVASAATICALGTMTSCNKTGFKVGLLCLHGQTSTYDKNFIEAFEKACKDNHLEEGKGYEIRTDVKEDYNDIYTAAKEWAEDGYSMIFADSFGHQGGLIDVAKEYPQTEFCHATGTTALLNYEPELKQSLKLHNYHNAFAKIFKGRYLAGVAAGAKMIEDINNGKYKKEEARIGYVGAWPYAEVISGYTSFYLGACSQFDNLDWARPAMYVKYTYSWYDYGAEKEAAFSLIRDKKCKLISQHADSMGAPQACAAEKIPNVCYNVSTKDKTPNTYLFGSKIDWTPYFDYVIKQARKKYDGASYEDYKISTDYVGDYKLNGDNEVGMVRTLDFGKIASEKVINAVNDVKDDLANDSFKIFDCSKFTITKKFYGQDDIRNRNPFAEVQLKDGSWSYPTSDLPAGTEIIGYRANVLDYSDDNYASDIIVTKPAGDGKMYVDESGYDMSGSAPTHVTDASFRSAPFFELVIDGIETLN